MAGRYKPYPEYKDSDNYWFGGLPENWKIIKLKQVVDQNRQITYGIVQAGPNIEGGIPYVRPADMTDENGIKDYEGLLRTSESVAAAYERSKVRAGDIICSIGPSFGKLMIAPDLLDGANLTQGTARVAISSEQFVRYFFWALRSPSSFNQWESSVGGATFRALNLGPLADTYLALPSKDEQEKIASFLDHETAKIDTLIEKQQQLIQLLKEKRQAVISHAVTKGLSSLSGGPNAKLRDSGVEWLGEVPEHWGVASIRRYLLEHRQGYYTTDAYVDEGTKLLRITDLRELGEISITDCPKVSFSETLKNYFLQEGDVVFARTGGAGSFGVVPLMHEVIAYASYLIRFRFLPEHFNTNYLRFMFVADSFQLAVKRNIHGGVTQNIHAEDIKDALVATPPLSEQLEIASYLDMQSSKYAVMISKASSAIELMQERRTALISAAVTGKIDVRDWVAPPASQTNKEVAA